MDQWEIPEAFSVNRRPAHARFQEDTFAIPGRWRCISLNAGDPLPPQYQMPSFSSKLWDKVEIPETVSIGPESEKALRIYRKRFVLPDGWLGHRVILRFSDIRDGCRIWLNGQEIGLSKGSLTAVEFEVSDHLQEGYNYLCVEVYRFREADFLYPASVRPQPGIPGPVDLYMLPIQYIRDLHVTASFGNSMEDAVAEIDVFGQDSDGLTARVAVMEQDKVCFYGEGVIENGLAHVVIPCPGVHLWSAESPNLYKIAVILWDGVAICHTRQLQFGFRRIRIEHTALELNCRPLTIKGITYCWESGRNIEDEICLIKKCGSNAIRVQAPAPEELFDLCDRYGLYVVEECMPARKDPEWIRLYQIQGAETVAAHRNHPCVLLWDLGCSRDSILELDRTRPVCREDLYCVLDPDLEVVQKMDRLEDLVKKPTGLARILAAPTVTESAIYKDYPLLALSFGKSYGNSASHLIQFADVFRKSKHWCGGFFWNFRDMQDLNSKEPRIATGLIAADGTPHASYHELQKGFQWIRCKKYEDGPIRVKNHYAFRNLSSFDTVYSITRDGIEISRGTLDLDVAPGCKDTIRIPHPQDMYLAGIYHLNIRMTEKADSPLAGSTVAYFQWELEHGNRLYQANPGGSIRDSEGSVILKTDHVSYTVNRTTGNLDQITLNGTDLLLEPLTPAFCRAYTDAEEQNSRRNDLWSRITLKKQLPKPGIVEVDHMAHQVTVSQNIASGMTRYYRIHSDGSLLVEMRLRTGKAVPDRIGMEMRLDSDFDRYQWIGMGPWDTYTDRNGYGWFGCHELPVRLQDEYQRAQEHGSKQDIISFNLIRQDSTVLCFETDQPMDCSVWPYSLEDLMQGNRTPNGVTVNLNCIQNGLETTTIRPHTTYTYSFLIRPSAGDMEL